MRTKGKAEGIVHSQNAAIVVQLILTNSVMGSQTFTDLDKSPNFLALCTSMPWHIKLTSILACNPASNYSTFPLVYIPSLGEKVQSDAHYSSKR